MRWPSALLALALGASVALSAYSQEPAAPAGPAATGEVRGAAKVDALVQEGTRLMQGGKWKEATDLLEQVAKLDPSNEVARFGLGTAYLKVGRYKAAETLLSALLAQFPGNPALQNNMAWLYAKATDPALRNPGKAIRYAQDALFSAPEDPNIWGTLAEAYYAAGRYDRALRIADAALRMAATGRDNDVKEFEELFQRCRIAASAATQAEKSEKPGTAGSQ